MAKTKKIPVEGLTQYEHDVFAMGVLDVMSAYNRVKQGVYDSRNILKKRLEERGYTVDEALELPIIPESVLVKQRANAVNPKKVASPKKGATVQVHVKRAYNKSVVPEVDNTEADFSFAVDESAPNFTGSRSMENAVLLTNLDKYLAKGDTVWPVNRPITIDASKSHAIKTHLNKNHPEYKWSVMKIPGNDKKVWLYKAKHK